MQEVKNFDATKLTQVYSKESNIFGFAKQDGTLGTVSLTEVRGGAAVPMFLVPCLNILPKGKNVVQSHLN